MDHAVPRNERREFFTILGVWLLLSAALLLLAIPNTSVPGLFYDEAHCAGMARDFLTGHAHPHMVGATIVKFLGRPFPTFVQPYGGAIKSWMLAPVFAVFGASQAVLRLTDLSLGLLALLLFMLWTWRWLGRNTALIGGLLLATDPTYFFISVFDWGPALPSFLCRFACFYCALRWWRLASEATSSSRRINTQALLAGVFAGLGFFNKIDFAVLLGGIVLALVCWDGRRLWSNLILRHPAAPAIACVGAAIMAGLMLPHLLPLLKYTAENHKGPISELTEKLNVMLAMYDGSYFYRLMDAGGRFTEMFQSGPAVFTLLGIATLLAAGCLAVQGGLAGFYRDASGLIVLTLLFVTVGILLLPGAVRIHHIVLVYPWPHLLVALAIARLWRRRCTAILLVLLVASQLFALVRTRQLIEKTGGRGWWSDSLTAFAAEVKDRSDLTIVSMDWGFNEQLAFLTDGPALAEPFWWGPPPMPHDPRSIYLVHPPEYSLLQYGPKLLQYARRLDPATVEIKAWRDHEGHVAFYAIHFLKP